MKFGFVILIVESRETGKAPHYTEVRDMAQQAEEAGFDSIWLYDHLLYRSEGTPTRGIWECWTFLSALAEATEKVELGTLVLCNSFRNPAILAKMAITLDEVSNGRFIMGLGAGWNKPEYDAFGIPFDHRVDRFEEAVKIIHPLIKEGQTDFNGKYYRASNCEIAPFGPRKPGPPLQFGSFRPRMMKLTAQYADIWNTGYLGEPDMLRERLESLEKACVEVGRDFNSLEKTVMIALAYPDLADPPAFMENTYLTGPTETLVQAFKEYEELGVSHLMFHCSPYNTESMGRLVKAIQTFREL